MALDKLEAYIEDERTRFEVQGVAVAVVQGDDVLLDAGFGMADAESGRAMTNDTVLAIGSSTKAFTSTAIGALVDEGKLEWDTPVREYLPGFRMYDPVATEHLTVRDMLSHRSGLPRHDLFWYSNEKLTRAEVVARLRFLQPSKSFREVWQYNNLMYLTAGHLIDVLTGETWEEAVQRRILDKLGMSLTSFTFDSARASGKLATPYAKIDDEVRAVPHRSLDLAGPAGSINSTVGDMAKWLQCNVNGGARGGVEVISAPNLKKIHQPSMVMPEGPSLWEETYGGGYAMGWFLENYRGVKVVHHGGNVDGFTALMAFAPKEKIGVAVLANMNGTSLPTVVAYRALDELLGLDPLPWGERYKGYLDAMMGGVKEARQIRKSKTAGVAPSHPLSDFVGEYAHPGYGPLTVAADGDGGSLTVRFNGLELELTHRHYDLFDAEYKTLGVSLEVTFHTASDGTVSGVKVPLEPTVDPILFDRQPDQSLNDPAVLAKYQGTYELGPIKVKVELKDEVLQASVAGQAPGELVPHQGTIFKIKEAPSQTIEFELDDDGVCRRAIVQPAGVFNRVEE
jgi:CubicO group peptidase (beta-lactamase class C family)